MIRYLARRLLQAALVMLIVSVIVFVILHALPGGLVRAQLGPRASTYSVDQLERAEGLLKPLPVQYGIWLLHLLQGNFGFSYKLNQPVAELLVHYLPRTLLLVGISSVLTVAIGVPMGLWQGYRRSKPDDHALSASMLILYAMPDFLLGVILIILLSLDLPVLPSTASAFGTSLPTDISVLVLPIAALTLGNVSYFSRYMRSSVIDSMLEDYVRTARAKGNWTAGCWSGTCCVTR